MRAIRVWPILGGLLLIGCGESRREPSDAPRIDRSARADNSILPRFGEGQTTTGPALTVPPPPPGASPPSNTGTSGGGTLPDGEYACYGSGGTVLAGLGFEVSGGRYTDLDGKDQGTVAVDGSDVVFTGGHMSGIGRGRDFKGKSFRAGDMAVCEKW